MATAEPHLRIYRPSEVVSFRKTKEAYGGLSNMAAGYPIKILEVRIGTSEALYQACRFPHLPMVQKLIIDQVSPMTAKMRSKPYRQDSRPDWNEVRVSIMRWCLRVKLIQNWAEFGALLLATDNQPIVEDSTKDDFWGAMRDDEGVLRGRNVLGRLLMELRDKLRTDPDSLEIVQPVPISNFNLFSHAIPAILRADAAAKTAHTGAQIQPFLEFPVGPPVDKVPTRANPVMSPLPTADPAIALRDEKRVDPSYRLAIRPYGVAALVAAVAVLLVLSVWFLVT